MTYPVQYAAPLTPDRQALKVVKALRHHTGNQVHDCKCDECKAIVRVCALALERIHKIESEGSR